ncbi:O-sialoglycoprotein endopeptidase [Tepidibacillus fermentans]|uniref:N(6)-L-threonylcarbamoyladenine synthase n=1 Tax=Tepidibacillus fermentans TaxID=1281767 RepID=A0A4R3KK90_9BACI|nr:O-sialoglycoprotein endopeptidase [Tepidibacillus fermentans]TCS84037.1 N6-L-threonylcarbamoyladenine synthase [Tepidibacillus fermentans]
MKKKVFLGIDTSNYMTSICFIDENRNILYEAKKLLNVNLGKRGLQQSEAVYQHIKNLPELFKGKQITGEYQLSGIAVSRAPRPVENSYMPVFQVGLTVAETMASTFSIPIYYTTHQEGHIAAGIYSSQELPQQSSFLAVHLSGGTSEILLIKVIENGYEIEKIGGTLDLHAGQLVDRIGVLLGYPFPAGKHIEQLAATHTEDFDRIPTSVKNYSFHFSGAETEAKRRLAQGTSPAQIARAIEHQIATSIGKALKNAIESNYPKEILIVGGVAQNQYIRKQLRKMLEKPTVGAKLFFADPAYSGDNAFGIANIALNQHLKIF